MTETTIKIEVPRGRTIVHNGKSYRPGEHVELPSHEARELLTIGHAIRPGDPQPAPGQIIRPLSPAELAELPPGPVPIHPGTALGPRVFSR